MKHVYLGLNAFLINVMSFWHIDVLLLITPYLAHVEPKTAREKTSESGTCYYNRHNNGYCDFKLFQLLPVIFKKYFIIIYFLYCSI